jgi:hypothetical protein
VSVLTGAVVVVHRAACVTVTVVIGLVRAVVAEDRADDDQDDVWRCIRVMREELARRPVRTTLRRGDHRRDRTRFTVMRARSGSASPALRSFAHPPLEDAVPHHA